MVLICKATCELLPNEQVVSLLCQFTVTGLAHPITPSSTWYYPHHILLFSKWRKQIGKKCTYIIFFHLDRNTADSSFPMRTFRENLVIKELGRSIPDLNITHKSVSGINCFYNRNNYLYNIIGNFMVTEWNLLRWIGRNNSDLDSFSNSYNRWVFYSLDQSNVSV